MNKTLCIVSAQFAPHIGGVERFTLQLSKYLSNIGWKVIVICAAQPGSADWESIDTITVCRLPAWLPADGRFPVPKPGKKTKLLLEKVASLRPELIFTQCRFYVFSFLAASLAKKWRIPHIIMDHGAAHLTMDNPLLDMFGEWYEHLQTAYLKRSAAAFLAVSEGSARWLEHFHITARAVLHNSIAQPVTANGPTFRTDDRMLVVFGGRLVPEKGIVALLEATRELNVSAVIAGDGAMAAMLAEKYTHAHFCGKLESERMMDLLRDADVLTLPSLRPEGLPTTILEAGWWGKAVVATPYGGTTELITDRETGLLVQGDTVESLTPRLRDALIELRDDTALRHWLGANLQKLVRTDFEWTHTAQLADEIFCETISHWKASST